MYISNYSIDYGVAYRLIAPGYEVYSKMGIYQRNLSNFEETAIVENTLVPGMCVNCHSFNKTNPDKMSMHVRGKNGGTLMQLGNEMEMLDTKQILQFLLVYIPTGIRRVSILLILSTIRVKVFMR